MPGIHNTGLMDGRYRVFVLREAMTHFVIKRHVHPMDNDVPMFCRQLDSHALVQSLQYILRFRQIISKHFTTFEQCIEV